jgi:hypothetical protein
MVRLIIILIAKNYILVVDALSLQQDLVVDAVDLVQQVFPLAHFLLFFFPLSAKVTAVTNNAAVANKNTFFMIILFLFYTT